MSLRTLHVISGLGTGGAENALASLLSAASETERRASAVVSLGGPGELGPALALLGVRVECLRWRRSRPPLLGLVRLARLVGRLDPQLVAGWMYHGNAAASVAHALARIAGGRRRPIVWHVRHGLDDLAGESWFTGAAIRLGSRLPAPRLIVYNSRAAAAQHERIGYPARCTRVVPNGFDLARFRPLDGAGARLRRELGLPHGATLVGLLARLHPVKDHVGFLDAAARASSGDRDVHFVLAGRGVEPREPALAGPLAHPALRGRVHLLGARADVPELTAGLDVACCSSRAEAFPTAIGEAMAAGVPCVVTDVGDARELVGDTGRVVPPRAPVAFARALVELLDAGAEGRRRLGRAARQRIAARYPLARFVAAHAALAEEALTPAAVRARARPASA